MGIAVGCREGAKVEGAVVTGGSVGDAVGDSEGASDGTRLGGCDRADGAGVVAEGLHSACMHARHGTSVMHLPSRIDT